MLYFLSKSITDSKENVQLFEFIIHQLCFALCILQDTPIHTFLIFYCNIPEKKRKENSVTKKKKVLDHKKSRYVDIET